MSFHLDRACLLVLSAHSASDVLRVSRRVVAARAPVREHFEGVVATR